MYKIKNESEHHYEIEMPEGASLHVAKAGLSDKMHKNIRKMCEGGVAHYNEGVDSVDMSDVEETPAVETALDTPEVPETPAAVDPTLAVAGATPKPAAPTAIPTAPTSPEVAAQYQASIDEEKKGLEQQAKATTDLGKAKTAVLDEHINSLEELKVDHDINEEERLAKQNDLAKQITATNIDPKAYFHNQGTAGKIGTVVSLLLGGIAAGGTGGINQAVSVLDSQIKADVDAQKANLENKHSLFSKLLQQTQDERQAYLMAQSHQLSIAQAKLDQEGARNMGPQAQGALAIARAALTRKQADLSQQLYVAKLRNTIATGGKFDARLAPFASNPASVVSMGDGTAIQASSPQGAAKVQDIIGKHQPVVDTLDKLEELSVNPLRPNSPEYHKAQSLLVTLMTQLKSATGINRLTPETQKMLEHAYSNPTELKELLIKDNKSQVLKQSIKEQMEAQMAPYLPSMRTRSSLGAHAKRK